MECPSSDAGVVSSGYSSHGDFFLYSCFFPDLMIKVKIGPQFVRVVHFFEASSSLYGFTQLSGDYGICPVVRRKCISPRGGLRHAMICPEDTQDFFCPQILFRTMFLSELSRDDFFSGLNLAIGLWVFNRGYTLLDTQCLIPS